MQLKSYTLALSLVVIALPRLLAQQPAPSATPKSGYIRFWNMLPAVAGNFELRKSGVSGPEAVVSRAGPYGYSSYVELPLGKYQLTVVKASSPETPVRNVAVDLKADAYYTVALMPSGAGTTVEFSDDTIDPKATTGVLTIRNCYPGITVAISAGGQHIVDSLSYGQSFTAKDLPPQHLQLSIQTKLPNGQPAASTADADFKAQKRATLLIIPDSYGRFRPRLAVDGSN